MRVKATKIAVIILLANVTLGGCPPSLPIRKVSDEYLDRDETSCVRLATKLSQVIVNFIANFQSSSYVVGNPYAM